MANSMVKEGCSASSPSPLSNMQSPRSKRPCLKALPLNLLKEAPLFSPRPMGSPRPGHTTSASELKTPRTARGSKESSIKVFVRIRPLQDSEKRDDSLKWTDNQIQLSQSPSGAAAQSYTLGQVLEPGSTQDDMMNLIGRPMVENVMAGYNACCIAYGQTGSGKTFTMLGSPTSLEAPCSGGCPSQLGLAPRVFKEVFQRIAERERTPVRGEGSQLDFTCRCSFLQIYAEKISDLLQDGGREQALALLSSAGPGQAVQVKDLSEHLVLNEDDVMELIAKGVSNRHVRETHMNMHSSRSHSVFTMRVECRATDSQSDVAALRFGTLHFVDLAGSERTKETGAAGAAMREAQHINRSLSTLRRIIHQVVEAQDVRSCRESTGGTAPHIHYRDSKLTFLLQHSLGGNSRTFLVANVSPAVAAAKQTKSTLEFVATAKKVKNVAKVNRSMHGDKEALQAEVAHLKAELAHIKGSLEDKGRQMQQAVHDATLDMSAACVDMRDLEAEASHSKDRCSELEAERDYLQAEVTEHCAAAASARDEVQRLQEENQAMVEELTSARDTIAGVEGRVDAVATGASAAHSTAVLRKDEYEGMQATLQATRAERDKLAESMRELEAAAGCEGRVQKILEGFETKNQNVLALPCIQEDQEGVTKSTAVVDGAEFSGKVNGQRKAQGVIEMEGPEAVSSMVSSQDSCNDSEGLLVVMQRERDEALSRLKDAHDASELVTAERDEIQRLLDEQCALTNRRQLKVLTSATSHTTGSSGLALQIAEDGTAAVDDCVAVRSPCNKQSPRSLAIAGAGAAGAEVDAESDLADSGSRTWRCSVDAVIFEQTSPRRDTGVSAGGECASFPVTFSSGADITEESEAELSRVQQQPCECGANDDSGVPRTPDSVSGKSSSACISPSTPDQPDTFELGASRRKILEDTMHAHAANSHADDRTSATSDDYDTSAMIFSDDSGKENRSAAGSATRMRTSLNLNLPHSGDSTDLDTLATLPEESAEDEMSSTDHEASELGLGLGREVSGFMSRVPEASLEASDYVCNPGGVGLRQEASTLFQPLLHLKGDSECDSDSDDEQHPGLGCEPTMLAHLDCGEGESGSQCASVSMELNSEPSMANQHDACDGGVHAQEEDWGSEDESGEVHGDSGELSWAVCSTVCDVSGAEAGLKAMIADMATVPDSGESAGKIPGAIQSPSKKRNRKVSHAQNTQNAATTPSTANKEASEDLAKDSSVDEVWDPCTVAREECGKFEEGGFDSVGHFTGPQWQAGGACTPHRELPAAVPNSPRVVLQEGHASSLYERSSFSKASSRSGVSSPRSAATRKQTVPFGSSTLSPRSPRGGGSDAGVLQKPLTSKLRAAGQEKEREKWAHGSGGKPGNMKVPRLALGCVRRIGEDPACISSGRQAPASPEPLSPAKEEENVLMRVSTMPHVDSAEHIADHISYVSEVNDEEAANHSQSIVDDSLPAQVATEASKEFWDQMIPETSRSLELDSEGVATGAAGERRKSGGVSDSGAEGGGGASGSLGEGDVEGEGESDDESSDDDSPKSAAAAMGCTTPELATVAAIKKSALTLFGRDRNGSTGPGRFLNSARACADGQSDSETSARTILASADNLTPRSRHIWNSHPTLTPRSRARIVVDTQHSQSAPISTMASSHDPHASASSELDEESNTSSRTASHDNSRALSTPTENVSDATTPTAPEAVDPSHMHDVHASIHKALKDLEEEAAQQPSGVVDSDLEADLDAGDGGTTPRTPRGTRIAAAVAATITASGTLEQPCTPRGSTFRSNNSFCTASSRSGSIAGLGSIAEGLLRSVDSSLIGTGMQPNTPRGSRPNSLHTVPAMSSTKASSPASKWRRWSTGDGKSSTVSKLTSSKAARGSRTESFGLANDGIATLRTPRKPRGSIRDATGGVGGGAADRAAAMQALSPRGDALSPRGDVEVSAAVCFGSGSDACALGCWGSS